MNNECIDAIVLAIKYYEDEGNFSQAARNHEKVGEVFESNGNLEKAIEHLLAAIDYFEGESQDSFATKCYEKLAKIYVRQGEYIKAYDFFRKLASFSSGGGNLRRYSINSYLLNAGLCVICTGDEVKLKTETESISLEYFDFKDTDENKCLMAIVEALTNNNLNDLDNVISENSSLFQSDPFSLSLLDIMKKSIK